MIKSPSTWSRRGFITAIAGTGTALMLNPLYSWALEGIDPKVAAIVAATIGVDTHNHIDVPLSKSEIPGPKIDLTGEMKQSGFSAICMTFAMDYQRLTNPGEAYERFLNGLASMDQQLANSGMKRSLNLADLQDAHKNKQPTVIQSVEGGHFLEGQIDRLAVAYGRGLRHIGLLHDSDASTPLGDVYTNPPRWGGLTEFGAAVVKESNRLGIVIDLTHCDTATVAAAIKLSTKPVMFSHTGLDTQLGSNPNMANMMKPRLISKTEAKVLADAGAIIGVWTHLADSALEYAQNIRALVDVVGVDHVCIGTDTKLTGSYRSPNDKGGFGGPPAGGGQGPRPGGDTSHGQGGPGGPGRRMGGDRTNQTWDGEKFGFFYTVVDAMLQTGFTPDEITKIGGGNFCRVFDAATEGKG